MWPPAPFLLLFAVVVVVRSDLSVRLTRQERQLLFEPKFRLGYHLDNDSLVDDGLAWRSPVERFIFYTKLLTDIEEQNEGGGRDRKSKLEKRPHFLPHRLLRRKIAKTNARLLRYASEFEKISHTTGAITTAGGAMGILGGLLTITGLALAPFTAGGSLALTGLSMAASTIGSSILVSSAALSVPSGIVAHEWEKHYIAKSADEAKSVMLQCDHLAVILGQCHHAFQRLDNFIRKDFNESNVEQEVGIWLKNVYVTARKSIEFTSMTNKLDIIKDVAKAGKKISSFVTSSVDEFLTLRLKVMNSLTLKRSLSKTPGQNVKILMRQAGGGDGAIKFAASGIEIPWIKNSELVWKTIVKAGGSAAVFLSLAGSVTSVAAGIWGVLSGTKSIKGSGIISDRIRRAVTDVDDYAARTFHMYGQLSSIGDGNDAADRGDLAVPLVLTGIEVHTCWETSAGTDSPVRVEVRSGEHKCRTNVLETYAHDDLEINQWDTYDNEAVLGDCSEFLLSHQNVTRVRLVNSGAGAHCADTVNLQVGYLDRSRYSCSHVNDTGVWTDYSNGAWLQCTISPDISRIDVYPCLSDYAGTDSSVLLALQSERELCFTDILDNNGNDLARGYKNSYRQDVLADCSAMRIQNNALRMSVVHGGYDALCLGTVLVQGVDGKFGRNREFKCDIPPQEIVEYDTSDIFDCPPFDPDPSKSVWGIRPKICDETYSGSSTGYDYGVAFEICSNSSSCCLTNYLDMLYYDELTTGSAVLYEQPGSLGQCYGFGIERSTNLTVSVVNTNTADAVCVESVDIYVKHSLGQFPFASCPVGVWTTDAKPVGPFECRSAQDTTIAQVETYICDVQFAGTDSSIEFEICRSGGDATESNCCRSGALDRPGKDDFEQGDFETYSASELGSCFDFEIDGDVVDLSVINFGSDGVCFGGLVIRTSKGDAMDCAMPAERDEYWVDNGRMDLRCVNRVA